MISELVYLQQHREPRTVLVGVQLDAKGEELLSWAVGKAAEQGDRVVAVHVCRDSDLKINTTLSLVRMLDDYLATYQGICTLKQVSLVGKVSRGNSIKKVIVKEANDYDATKIIVGVDRHCTLGFTRKVLRQEAPTDDCCNCNSQRKNCLPKKSCWVICICCITKTKKLFGQPSSSKPWLEPEVDWPKYEGKY